MEVVTYVPRPLGLRVCLTVGHASNLVFPHVQETFEMKLSGDYNFDLSSTTEHIDEVLLVQLSGLFINLSLDTKTDFTELYHMCCIISERLGVYYSCHLTVGLID